MILRFVPRIPSDTKSTAAHWYRCSLHSGNWCEIVASIVCNAFSAYRKSVQNTSGTRMVRNLAVWGRSRIGVRMGRRVIEMGITFVVDQLPVFNKLALHNPFKVNRVWEYTISHILFSSLSRHMAVAATVLQATKICRREN